MKPEEEGTESRGGLQRIARALHHRNYRLFFAGQSISLIGTWMQRVALSWLVYQLTHSAFLLGVVGFASQLPILLLTPLGGVFADRWNRHRTLLITQTLALLQALTLAILILTGHLAIWHIISLGMFLGFVDALDMPVRQSFVVEMVEKREDLGNAIALNSSMVNGARLIGPSVAGILIASVGEGMCFLLNALSYLAVIGSLLAMKVTSKSRETRRIPVLREIGEGFSYAYGCLPIRSVLLLITLVSLMGMPYSLLMPIFARDILHGDSHTLGFLMGASGVGALVGGFYLATLRNSAGLARWNAVGAALFGAGLIAFSQSRLFWFSMSLMFLTGFGMLVQHASSNTLLQTLVEENKRGRVMSFYGMAFRGITPFGSLMAGTLASRMGAPNTLLLGGIACMVGAMLYAKKLKDWPRGTGEAP